MESMRRIRMLFCIFIVAALAQTSIAQTTIESHRVPNGKSGTILIENGQLYRITISSCWYSAYARIGTYLVYGLNVSDPKTNERPTILTVAETRDTDWSFRFSLQRPHDAEMRITSQGWGDQGLLIFVEKLGPNRL